MTLLGDKLFCCSWTVTGPLKLMRTVPASSSSPLVQDDELQLFLFLFSFLPLRPPLFLYRSCPVLWRVICPFLAFLCHFVVVE